MIDTTGHTWAEVKTHIEARLVLLRNKLEMPSTDAERTALCRGGIRELKELLALPEKLREERNG